MRGRPLLQLVRAHSSRSKLIERLNSGETANSPRALASHSEFHLRLAGLRISNLARPSFESDFSCWLQLKLGSLSVESELSANQRARLDIYLYISGYRDVYIYHSEHEM